MNKLPINLIFTRQQGSLPCAVKADIQQKGGDMNA